MCEYALLAQCLTLDTSGLLARAACSYHARSENSE